MLINVKSTVSDPEIVCSFQSQKLQENTAMARQLSTRTHDHNETLIFVQIGLKSKNLELAKSHPILPQSWSNTVVAR